MSADLYMRAKELVQRASTLPEAERAAFLDAACAAQPALRKEVDSWLDAVDEASTFLGSGALKICRTCDSTFPDPTRFCPKCGEALHDDPRALVGSKIDDLYVIEDLLGQGGMGAVYLARHALLGDRVALKTLNRELCESPHFLKRFQREAQAARAFRHPNAVVVHDLRATKAGLLYMVLEYVEGRDLRDLLRTRNRLTVREALEILSPIADVLDAAHAAGVVHRDLKPDNVMIASGDHGRAGIKLLDLGIAKLRQPDTFDLQQDSLTMVNQILGTPAYMSPEQWGASQRDGLPSVDGRADVYSLAVMAFEMLAGERPFASDSVDGFRGQHIGATVPEIRERGVDVPESFAKELVRGLAKDRSDRPRTAGELVSALSRAAGASESTVVLESAPAPAPLHAEYGLPQQTQQRTHVPWRSIIGVVAVLLVIGLGALYTLFRPTSVPRGELGRAPVTPAPPRAVAPPWPATSIPARGLAYTIEVRRADGSVSKSSGLEPVGDARAFRFRFIPGDPGYFYLLGPDESESLTLLHSGTKTGAGDEFATEWMTTTADSKVDGLTVVFAREQLRDLPVLSKSPPYTLLPAEKRAFDKYRYDKTQSGTISPSGQHALVKPNDDTPIMFDIELVY